MRTARSLSLIHILTGIPGKSNAFAIAARLGLQPTIIERAKEQVSTEDARFEDVLAELERERRRSEQMREEEMCIRDRSKVDPYLRPLYDGLFDMLGAENFTKYQERGSIEVAPLAYMRGRTLDDSFIILDEAQNTTPEQMKMFLTRLGFGSQAVITGDITQIDLPDGKQSGLKEALRVLDGVEGIAQCYLTEKDVVRLSLIHI